jgi:hypothetical protein
MQITDFITAAGFIVAIIILRVTHWLDHNKASHSETAQVIPQIWSYYAVTLGLLAIIYVSFHRDNGAGTTYTVTGIPFVWFIQMAIMACLDVIISPVLSLVLKVVIRGESESSSFLALLDEKLPRHDGIHPISKKGKV